MSDRRTPVWKIPDTTTDYLRKDRWKSFVSGVLACFAVVFFVARITPWLSDASLFWLKLIAFIITATLGVVGVVADFKDENKKLTRPGKLNLAGLVLAAVVGIMAQKAEYDSSNKASAEAKKSLLNLNRQNQTTLERVKSLIEANDVLLRTTRETNTQVARALEPVGEDIEVRYRLRMPLEVLNSVNSEAFLRKTIKELGVYGLFRDSNTLITKHASDADYSAFFDKDSRLMPREGYAKKYLSEVSFELQFHRRKIPDKPVAAKCTEYIKPDAYYVWDEATTTARAFRSFSPYDQPGPVSLQYETNQDYIVQTSDAYFRMKENRGIRVSALDFSQSYVRLNFVAGNFETFEIRIGSRWFPVHPDKLAPDYCHGFTFQLPKFN
jgi:hypothetical protein